jgi:hypothetical protein
MCSCTGLGGSSDTIMNNEWSENQVINEFIKTMGDEAISLYFEDYEGFDFGIEDNSITIGIEPTYQYDNLRIIHINKNKDDCYYQTGKAFGLWGSRILSKTKYYKDYVKKCKFKNFVDKWQPLYVKSIL